MSKKIIENNTKDDPIPLDTESNSTGVKDPTTNVQNLLRAAVIRQDDLRNAEVRRVDERFIQEQQRVDDLRRVTGEYERLLEIAESKRIDAIRVVDVNAVNVANDRATSQASVLASQVSASADTLRTLVATTATAMAQQLALTNTQFTERIANLEKNQYTGQGRESYTDPLMTAMLGEIKVLTASITETRGKGLGAAGLWGYIIGGIGLLGIILGIILSFRAL